MTEGELDELQRLHEQASQGPWHTNWIDDDWCMRALVISQTEDDEDLGEDMSEYNNHRILAATLIQQPRYLNNEKYRENAELIVAVRNALPKLLAAARTQLA